MEISTLEHALLSDGLLLCVRIKSSPSKLFDMCKYLYQVGIDYIGKHIAPLPFPH